MTIFKTAQRPLKLNIQFFAEENKEEDKSKKPDVDDFGDALPSLKDLFKKYPHLRAEHKSRIDDAVAKRFPDYDFDPVEAKKALQEKADREKNGDNVELLKTQLENDFQSKEQKYLARIKGLAVEAYAAKDGLDPKLISKLAADQVGTLKLDEGLRLNTDDLDEIIEELRIEFPTAFPVVETKTDDDPDEQQQTSTASKKFNPGVNKTNNPPKAKDNVAEEVAAIFENIKAKKKHL